MDNGNGSDLLESVQKILDGEGTIPPSVSNKLVLAAVMHVNRKVAGLRELVTDCQLRIGKLEKCDEIEAVKNERFVSWPWLLEKFGQPVVMAIIAALIGIAASRLFP